MFKPEYLHGWKKALLLGIVGFLLGTAFLFCPEPLTSVGAITIVIVPLVCLFILLRIVFLNYIKRSKYLYIETLIPSTENIQYVYESIQKGTAEVFDNEMVVVTDKGILAVTDTSDFYYFDDIENIVYTHNFEGREVPKMNFIKLEEQNNNYYIAIIEKWDLKSSYDLCVKACQERLKKYKLNYTLDI